MGKKIKTIFIEDLHGVKDFYSWQIGQLKKINPQAICLEMLPREEKFIEPCQRLVEGDISPEDFRKQTDWEKHWGTFEGYALLFGHLRGSGILLCPIDQNLKDRRKLVQREKRIIRNFQAGKDIQALVNQSRVELFLAREAVFAQNILDLVRTEELKKLAVLVGRNHIERLVHFFNFLDEFKAEDRRLSGRMKEKLDPLYGRVHLKFARERKVLAMRYPPLVPINALRFRTASKKKSLAKPSRAESS